MNVGITNNTVNNTVSSAVNTNVNVNVTVNNGTPAAEPAVKAPTVKEQDTFQSTGSQDNKTYKPDIAQIRKLWEENNAKVDSFRRLVEGLFNRQAEKNNAAEGAPGRQQWAQIQFEDGTLVEVDEELRAAAQKEIDEGGYYSVEKTASRILSFAVALSGGDPSKVDLLRDAAMKGFAQAEKAWGSELPEISKKTLEAVQKGFDEWKTAGSADAITLLNKQ